MEIEDFNTGDGLSNGEENIIRDIAEETPEVLLDEETFSSLEDLVDLDDEALEPKDPEAEAPEIKDKPAKEDEDSSPYSDITNYFKEKGILSDLAEYEDEDFKFDGTEDSFKELMDRHAQKKAFEVLENDILPQLPASARKKIELMFENELGSEDAEDIGERLSNYSSLSKSDFDSNPDKAKKIYTEYLKSRNMDDDEIEELVQRAVDLEEIGEKAEKARLKLISNTEKEIEQVKDKRKQEEAVREQQQVKKLENLKSSAAAFVKQVSSADFKLDEKLADKIYESRTKIVAYSKDKQPLNKVGELAAKDPEGFQNSLHLLSTLDFFKIDKNGTISPNFTKISKQATAQAVKKTVSTIDKISNKFTLKGNNAQDSDDDDDVLNQLKQTFK